MIQELIKTVASSQQLAMTSSSSSEGHNFKTVVLTEADLLTKDAQVRFCFTYTSKLSFHDIILSFDVTARSTSHHGKVHVKL